MKRTYELKAALHIAALVLGIISVVLSFFWYVTVPTGVLAIVFGAKSRWSALGKTGMILGIVGLSLFLLFYISMISIMILRF